MFKYSLAVPVESVAVIDPGIIGKVKLPFLTALTMRLTMSFAWGTVPLLLN